MEEEELSLPEMRQVIGVFFLLNKLGISVYLYQYRLSIIEYTIWQMCDVYARTLYPGAFGGSNTYLADEFLYACREIPELALDAFNNAKVREIDRQSWLFDARK